MSLYIGTAMADAELSESLVQDAIKSLAMMVAREKQKGGLPDGPSLDVTFMLPSQTVTTDFAGMRMGGYTKESDTLYFESAVPEHIVNSELAREYVTLVMQDVISNASSFFKEYDIGFDNKQWQLLVSRLIKAVSANKSVVNIMQ